MRGLLAWLFVFLSFATAPASADPQLWAALKQPGHFALMRHALAPGTGDPAEFRFGDCATQRNLSAGGRDQAVRIGTRLRAAGIIEARVYSSQWCRCVDTAELLALGPVVELPLINSFFREMRRRDTQTRALQAWMQGLEPGAPVVLVTHQVNITALTGVFPASGEIVVVRMHAQGEPTVLGRIATD